MKASRSGVTSQLRLLSAFFMFMLVGQFLAKPQSVSAYDKEKRRCYEYECSDAPKDLAIVCQLLCVDRECFYEEFIAKSNTTVLLGERIYEKVSSFDSCARPRYKLKTEQGRK